MIKFTPTKDFFSPELKSQYCVGLTYTVRPGDALLSKLVQEQWIPNGIVEQVKLSPGSASSSSMAGVGTVSDGKPKGFFERIKSWL